MYVRWQSRKRRSIAYGHGRGRDGDVHWRAILVENVRVDGKPSQRHVAYLGGITESAINLDTPAQRMFFWDKAGEQLDGLGKKLSVKDRKAIENALASKVPRVNNRQRKQVEKQRRAILGSLAVAGLSHRKQKA